MEPKFPKSSSHVQDSRCNTESKCITISDAHACEHPELGSMGSTETGDACVRSTGKEIQSAGETDGPVPRDKMQTHRMGREWCCLPARG